MPGVAIFSTVTPTNTIAPTSTNTNIPTKTEAPTKTNTAIVPLKTPSFTDADLVGVAPGCKTGTTNTTIAYGKPIVLFWGWETKTEQQQKDFINNIKMTYTFDNKVITDMQQSEIWKDGGTYHVSWSKTIGFLEKDTYAFGMKVDILKKIFDGWDYYGPGTKTPSIQEECPLIIK
jgi:hypothetical protein